MALKTFNVDDEVYKKFSKHCKEKGISMSKQVENFIRKEIEKILDASAGAGAGSNAEKANVSLAVDSNKIEKDIKNFDKSLEHPLRKYC